MLNFPKITINGVELTTGQAMTIHVALQSFAEYLQPQDVLGDDDHGKFMRDGYLNGIQEINKIYIEAV
ncbi:MAG: hypothetical protein M0R80_07650 [Proteobacteria bacterium]|jgi:hypothetical protein|nr:hypothetical protein [Pseudomonadota bacterium]